MTAVEEMAQRGFVYANRLSDKTTVLLRVSCPDCGASVRVNGSLSEVCASGCGWSRWRKES